MKQLKTAVIVIDMQADYIGEKSKNKYYPYTLIDKINDRIAAAVNHNESIIYVKNVGKRNKESYISDFVEGLSVVLPLTYIGIKSKERFSETREKLLKANVQIIEPQEGKCLG